MTVSKIDGVTYTQSIEPTGRQLLTGVAGPFSFHGGIMTPEFLVLTFGVVLSLIVSYVPGLNTAYEKLDGNAKRLVMLVGVVVIGAAVVGLNCAGVSFTGVPAVECSQAGALLVVEAIVKAAIANQAAYALTLKAKAE